MVKKRAKRSYSRRSKRSYRRKKNHQVPLSIVIPAVAPLFKSVTKTNSFVNFQSDPMKWGQTLVDQIGQQYTGISCFPEISGQVYHWDQAIPTWIGLGVGVAVHKFLGPLANRYMRKIPLVGKYIGI